MVFFFLHFRSAKIGLFSLRPVARINKVYEKGSELSLVWMDGGGVGKKPQSRKRAFSGRVSVRVFGMNLELSKGRKRQIRRVLF